MTTMPPSTSESTEEKMTTVIADDLHIKGTITFETSLMIKGSLEGEIVSKGLLVVGPTAKIDATIATKSLVSHGKIQGDVTASEQVVLTGTAVHTGKITTPNIVVESGSVFNGSCVMQRGKLEVPQEEDAVGESASPEAPLKQASLEEPQVPTPEVSAPPEETAEASALPAETETEKETTAAPSESAYGQFGSSRRGGSGTGRGFWPVNGK